MATSAPSPAIEELQRQEKELVFPAFDENTAWEIGSALVNDARERKAPIAIDIRTPNRTLFHAAMPGSAPENGHWAHRKGNVVLRQYRSSLLAWHAYAEAGEEVGSALGLDPMDFAAHGGGFPIRVAGVGVIGSIAVSGLPSAEDHRLIVVAIARYLGKTLSFAPFDVEETR